MPVTPTLHTFDPQIAGFIGAYIDQPASYDQVIWYTSHASTGPWTEIDVSWPSSAISADGLALVMHAGPSGATVYVECKLHDSTGYGASSAVAAAVVSSGPPPPLTDEQLVNQALGITLATGDIIDVYPATPTTSKTVNADGSIA